MKKMIIATVLAVGLATAGLVYAQGGYGGGYGMGPGYGWMGPGMGGHGYGWMGRGMRGYNGGYGCPGYGYGWGGAQNSWNSQQYQKFLEDTVLLRKQMNDKRFEYREALRNPNTTSEQLAKIEKEMIDLRTKISQKAGQIQ